MATAETSPQPEPVSTRWLDYLAKHRKETSYGLFALSALFAVAAFFLLKRDFSDHTYACFGAILLAVTAVGGGLWLLSYEGGELPELDAMRLLVLIVGGLAGLILSVAAVAQAAGWSPVFLGGIDKWQGPDKWKIWVCVVALLVGLALMFASLLLARTDEQANPLLRRLLHGYNAVLSGLLLLAVLLVANLLVYVFVERGAIPPTYDCTANSIYTLSSRSRNLLEHLDRPVTIYVLQRVRSDRVAEIDTLMANIRNVTDKVKVEHISPDLNPGRMIELADKYQLSGLTGLLVVYGEEGGTRADYDFINLADLYSQSPDPSGGGKSREVFKGEDVLMAKLSVLTEEKPLSQTVIDRLKKGGTVYALFDPRDPLYGKVQELLNASQSGSAGKLRVEYVSPDTSKQQVQDLRVKYPFNEKTGLLIVYGQATKDYDFFGRTQLFQKSVVYFTQGNGELNVNDVDPRPQLPDKGIGLLRLQLEKGNYDIKGLQLSTISSPAPPLGGPRQTLMVVSNRVPDDAAAVIIVAPRIPFSASAVGALRDYLNPPKSSNKKKGKLMVLFDVVPASNDPTKMEKTGLEDLLADFNIRVGQGEVFGYVNDRPMLQAVTTRNPDSPNPVALLFRAGMLFYKVRELEVATPPPHRDYRADALAVTIPNYTWVDENLDPRGIGQEYIEKRMKPDPLPVAIAVSELSKTGDGSQKQEPRLMVFGDATFVSNAYLADRSGGQSFVDIFVSSLAWLRERPSNIGIAPKQHDLYKADAKADSSRLVWLPVILMLGSIVGLGAGVWVVRRR